MHTSNSIQKIEIEKWKEFKTTGTWCVDRSTQTSFSMNAIPNLKYFNREIVRHLIDCMRKIVFFSLFNLTENKQWNKPKITEEVVYVEFDIEPQLFESDGKMIEQWNKPKQIGEQLYLEFDIEAQLFETDDSMVEQFRKISDVIIKHSKEGALNQKITLTILPIDLGKYYFINCKYAIYM